MVSERRGVWSWVALVVGAGSFALVGWRLNVPIAAWIAPLLLIRFFRDQERWYATLAAIPLLAVASFVQLHGGWDLDPWMEYVFCVLRPAPLLVALYADRALCRKLPAGLSTLVFPSVYLALDYVVALTPLGSGMCMGATQFGFPAVSQLASLAGIWGIGFLMGWVAASVNELWDSRPDPRVTRGVALAVTCVMVGVLAFGSARASLARQAAPTVRVGSVTVPHPRDYWSWIDEGTPRAVVAEHAAELEGLEEALLAQSERAAAAGARIIFWSEGNCVIPEEDEQAFLGRASAFARGHELYFAPAVLVLRYGQPISDNKILMFGPDGRMLASYTKTKSWYPTGSDGIFRVVETPYGRIGTAICFDMDFPGFIHGLGKLGADIVLVPAYDTEAIRPYHTEVGLMRGLENGFSVVRQTNEGTSMAIDGTGRVRARQEFFETSDRLMLADVPTRRVVAPDALLGDWFAYGGMALALGLIVTGIVRRRVA